MNIEGLKELFSSSKYSHKIIRNLFIIVVTTSHFRFIAK